MPGLVSENDRQYAAKRHVLEYIQNWINESGRQIKVSIDDIYVIRYVGVLQNWTCLIGTTLPDGTAYDITYNGDRAEFYLDVYKKFDSVIIKRERE